MKRTFFKFNSSGKPVMGPVSASIMRQRAHGGACLRSDGGGEDDDDDDDDEDDTSKEERMLLKKITKRMAKEFQTRGIKDKASIAALVATELNGLNLEELRKFGADHNKAIDSVKNIAGELEKIKQNMQNRGNAKVNAFAADLEKRMADVEKIHAAKGENREVVKMNVRAAAVMNVAGAVDETTNSIPTDLIESFSIAEFVGKRYGRQYIYDVADRTVIAEIDEYKTWLEEGDPQGAFAIVEEGAIKPLVSTGLVRNFAKAKKVAGKYVITEEFAKFRKNAYSIIRNLIMDKLVRDYNAIITADFQAEAAGYTGTALDGTITNANDYDAIGAVAAQIESLNFVPDVLILNSQDKWRLRLTKNVDGTYLFPMVTETGQTIVLSLRLITSTYQAVGSFTLAEAGLFKIEEEPISVRIGYGITVTGSNPVTQVVSDFDNNQMRVIVETFFRDWLATPNVGSIVTATFASVKTALTP